MLINKKLANKNVATSYGTAEFNDQGESNNLPAEDQKFLGENVPGFTYVEDKVEAKAKEKAVSDDEHVEKMDADERGEGQDAHAEKIRTNSEDKPAPKKTRTRKVAGK